MNLFALFMLGVVGAAPSIDSSVDAILTLMDSEIAKLSATIAGIMSDHLNGPSSKQELTKLDVHRAARALVHNQVPALLSSYPLDRIAEVQVEAERVLYAWFNSVLEEKVELVKSEIDFLMKAWIVREEIILPDNAELGKRLEIITDLIAIHTFMSEGQTPNSIPLELELFGSKFVMILRPLVIGGAMTNDEQKQVFDDLVYFMQSDSLQRLNEKDVEQILGYAYTQLQAMYDRYTHCLATSTATEACFDNANLARDRIRHYQKNRLLL